MIFVDDSNIWIEAQKFAASGNSHMPKLTDSDSDSRLRIDVGNLIRMILKKRQQGKSFLYGSRPPPNDSVWKAFEKFRFVSKIATRTTSGKEKEVDTAMSTDMAFEAAILSCQPQTMRDHTTFAVITGDRDLLPPIRKALDLGIHVEVWGWQSSIAKEYFRMQSLDGGLKVNLMEWIFQAVTFTNFRSTRQRYVEPGKTVVVCDVDVLTEDGADEMRICYDVLQLGRLFYTTRSPSGAELLVEFPRVVDVEDMIIKLRKLFEGRHHVLSWPEYNNRVKTEALSLVETSNMFMPLSEIEEGGSPQPPIARHTETTSNPQSPTLRHSEASSPQSMITRCTEASSPQSQTTQSTTSGQDAEDGEWTMVARTDPKKMHQVAQNRKQRCRFQVRCRKRGDCGFQHTAEELRMFDSRPNQNFAMWKTKACQNTQPHSSRMCPFAHSDAEAWCLHCRHEGHYTDNCVYSG